MYWVLQGMEDMGRMSMCCFAHLLPVALFFKSE
jgi:hypothetical protein